MLGSMNRKSLSFLLLGRALPAASCSPDLAGVFTETGAGGPEGAGTAATESTGTPGGGGAGGATTSSGGVAGTTTNPSGGAGAAGSGGGPCGGSGPNDDAD